MDSSCHSNPNAGRTCRLHLHGATTQPTGMMYSAMGTTGLVIGVGTIGEYLSERANDQQTFFSRDAGSTWKKVR